MEYLKVLVWSHYFLSYIDDLHLSLKISKATMNTDDTSICFSSGSVHGINSAVNEDLEALKIWLEISKLSLNVLKHRKS